MLTMCSVKQMLKICFLLCLLLQTMEIQTVCPCSNPNSYCLSNQYCQCNSGFIMDCSVPAFPLSGVTSDALNVQIDYSYTYFSIDPLTIDSYIVFTYKICPLLSQTVGNYQNVQIMLSKWGNSGRPIALEQNNAIDSQQYPITAECIHDKTSYFKFELQTNREKETLIIGLKLIETNSDPNNINSLFTNINVEQEEIFDQSLLLDLSFGILGVVGLTCCIMISCIVVKRLRNNAHQRLQVQLTYSKRKVPNIQHFDSMMPIKTAKQLNVTMNNPCAVCLSQMVDCDSLRITPCGHIFHSECLDSWCLKNTICPFCRNGLLKEDIEQYEKDKVRVDVDWQQNPMSGREVAMQSQPMLESQRNSSNIYQGSHVE